MTLVNPYSVYHPIQGRIEVRDTRKPEGEQVVKTFGDARKAGAYAQGRWDGERAMQKLHERS